MVTLLSLRMGVYWLEQLACDQKTGFLGCWHQRKVLGRASHTAYTAP